MKDCFLTKPSYLKQQQKEILRLTGQVNNMWKNVLLPQDCSSVKILISSMDEWRSNVSELEWSK